MNSRYLAIVAVILMGFVPQGSSQGYPGYGYPYITGPHSDRYQTISDWEDFANPEGDPLELGPLMQPLDPHHTAEYLEKLRGTGYVGYPFTALDLGGYWTFELTDQRTMKADMLLLQNGWVVFGKGTITQNGVTVTAACSGFIYQDALYLDLISVEDLSLYRCRLGLGRSYLYGGFYAFNAQGGTRTGTLTGRKAS
ncbi:MAG: hypothetical protein GKC10_01390 [Methanosarcinales archaeon]|nr:hypothetical protein [Methanosarcinales archaeon]